MVATHGSNTAAGEDFAAKAKLFFQRAFRTDLDPVRLLADEHVPIEIERVHGDSDPLRRVLLWRRAALFVALCFQIPPTFIAMIKTFVSLGEKGGGNDLDGVFILPMLANIALIVAMFVAHKRWDRWVRSRKILWWAWLIAFVGPFLLWLIPLRSVAGGPGGQQGMVIGLVAGLFVIIDLGPKVLALVPALMRTAIVTKTVLPGSPTPGWIMLLAAPFYLMLLYMLLLSPYQLAGGSFMAPAIILLMAAPIFMWRAGKQLVAPKSLDDVIASVRSLRSTTLITNALGGLFLLIGLIDAFGETQWFGVGDAILPLVQMVANVFLLAIVGLDILLPTMARAHVANQTPEYRDARVALERELDALAEATDSEPPPPEEPVVSAAPAPRPAPAAKPAVASIPKPAPPKPLAGPKPAPPAASPRPIAPLRPPPPRAAPAAEPDSDPAFDPDDPLAQTSPGGPPKS